MKVTVSKLFELFQLPQELQGVAPLVSYVNEVTDQVVKALQQRLTLRDNVACDVRELKLKKGASALDPWTAEFTPSQRSVEGIVLLQTNATADSSNSIASWHWRFTSKGSVRVCVFPRLPTSNDALDVKVATFFA